MVDDNRLPFLRQNTGPSNTFAAKRLIPNTTIERGLGDWNHILLAHRHLNDYIEKQPLTLAQFLHKTLFQEAHESEGEVVVAEAVGQHPNQLFLNCGTWSLAEVDELNSAICP